MKQKPSLSFWKLWNLSFGFFGVQIAYALQNANISRIFATLGADPHSLNYFWILPPLMGMVVQPLVGLFSDKTWTRFGRRIPYLFVGAAGCAGKRGQVHELHGNRSRGAEYALRVLRKSVPADRRNAIENGFWICYFLYRKSRYLKGGRAWSK